MTTPTLADGTRTIAARKPESGFLARLTEGLPYGAPTLRVGGYQHDPPHQLAADVIINADQQFRVGWSAATAIMVGWLKRLRSAGGAAPRRGPQPHRQQRHRARLRHCLRDQRKRPSRGRIIARDIGPPFCITAGGANQLNCLK